MKFFRKITERVFQSGHCFLIIESITAVGSAADSLFKLRHLRPDCVKRDSFCAHDIGLCGLFSKKNQKISKKYPKRQNAIFAVVAGTFLPTKIIKILQSKACRNENICEFKQIE